MNDHLYAFKNGNDLGQSKADTDSWHLCRHGK